MDTGSDRVGSIDGGSLQGQNVERRVAWLEEDVAVLHRRLRDDCGEGGTAGAAGDSGLRALVARLDGELAAERRSREAMEARINQLEETIRQERKEREAQLRGFSSELETAMRGLIERINDGVSAAAVRERTEVSGISEDRLRELIQRVDQGLASGAAALQDTLTATGAMHPPGQPPVGASPKQRTRQERPDETGHPGVRLIRQAPKTVSKDDVEAPGVFGQQVSTSGGTQLSWQPASNAYVSRAVPVRR